MIVLVIIAYAHKPSITSHSAISSRERSLNFSLSLHLHPYFVYANSEGSGESAHVRRLT